MSGVQRGKERGLGVFKEHPGGDAAYAVIPWFYFSSPLFFFFVCTLVRLLFELAHGQHKHTHTHIHTCIYTHMMEGRRWVNQEPSSDHMWPASYSGPHLLLAKRMLWLGNVCIHAILRQVWERNDGFGDPGT